MKIRGFLALAILASTLALTAVAGAADPGGPGGEMVAFVRQGNIWVARVDGTGERRLTDFGVCGGPALSPDGKQVAFHCRADQDIYPDTGFGQIYLVETAGGEPRRLKLEGTLAAEHPAFSPDGKSLIFVGLSEVRKQGKEDEAQVFATMSVSIADIQTGKTRAVLRHKNAMLDAGYIYSHPAFSPDGQWILWQQSGSDVSGGFAITDLKGKTLFRFPPKGEDPTPYWGPSLALDGQTVDHAPVDVHVGSIAVRRFIEARQPLLTLHGHIHESARLTGAWQDRIGRTVCLSAAHDGPELALVRFDLERPDEATRELL